MSAAYHSNYNGLKRRREKTTTEKTETKINDDAIFSDALL